jgi:hypothetical protein
MRDCFLGIGEISERVTPFDGQPVADPMPLAFPRNFSRFYWLATI